MMFSKKLFLFLAISGLILLTILAQLGTTVAMAAGKSSVLGLVSWWPGEGTADEIINGNNGTLELGASFATGKVGQAFSLDGVNDYVYVPHNANLSFGSNQDFSISAWVNLQNPTLTPYPGFDDEIVSKWNVQNFRNGTTSNLYRLFLQRTTHKVRFALVSANAGFELESNSAVNVDEWTHITVVRDGDQGLIYINGQLDKTGVITSGSVENSDPLAIGATYDTLFNPPVQQNHTFGGLIDEVKIYNGALSASEVESIVKNVTICHKPSTSAQKTIVIPLTALGDHLSHGDSIGPCE